MDYVHHTYTEIRALGFGVFIDFLFTSNPCLTTPVHSPIYFTRNHCLEFGLSLTGATQQGRPRCFFTTLDVSPLIIYIDRTLSFKVFL